MFFRKIGVKILGESNLALFYLRLFHPDRIIDTNNFPKQLPSDTKKRWLLSKPDAHLTWGINLSGDAFIDKVKIHGKILEIGPGGGRLLVSILDKELSFDSYIGLDLSNNNINYLNKKFGNQKIKFKQGDAENIQFDERFDVIISSLTFKHLYPTFEKALTNLCKYLKGTIYFDLIEGNLAYVQPDGTYIKHYTKKEILEILSRCNLKLERFDKVVHQPSWTRLLVQAKVAR